MKKSKILALGSLALIGILPLTACSSGGVTERSLSGTWDCVDEGDMYGNTYPVVFNRNGTMILDGDQGTWSIVSRSGTMAQVQMNSFDASFISEITALSNNEITVADYDGAGSSYCTRR